MNPLKGLNVRVACNMHDASQLNCQHEVALDWRTIDGLVVPTQCIKKNLGLKVFDVRNYMTESSNDMFLSARPVIVGWADHVSAL